ncbi:MAG: hypothetical protein ACLQVD_02720 [Capsulimonadaceae bacterium]
MTITLDPNQERRLRETAQERGVEPNALLTQIIDRALDDHPAPRRGTRGHRAMGITWASDDHDSQRPDSFWQ